MKEREKQQEVYIPKENKLMKKTKGKKRGEAWKVGDLHDDCGWD